MSKDKNRNNIDIDNTNYKYHDSDARIFLENLSKELSLVTQDPETMEREHFTIDGKVLCPEAKITYEMIRVLNEFVYQYEPSTDFTREDRIRNLIENAMKCIESEDYDYDTITQLLVHIELELGMPVLLTTALVRLAKSEYINEKKYTEIDKTNYEELYNHYYVGPHKGGRRK